MEPAEMSLWVKLILGALALMGAGVALLIWYAWSRWNDKSARLVDQLIQLHSGQRQKRVTFKELDQLPPPVARYFRWAMREGQPMISSARITQTGEFRQPGKGWSRFKANQYFSVQPPGFVWDASIQMAPLIRVRVRDAYIAGQASMQAKILSLVPVVDERGKTELKAAALQRYLAEAAWFPTALLPSAGVKWSAIDENRALATLTDSGITVSLEFRFNQAGEITSVFAPSRYREANGKYEKAPWEGHHRNYKEKEGMRVPTEGEVEWHLPDGKFPYWKGTIVETTYGFVE